MTRPDPETQEHSPWHQGLAMTEAGRFLEEVGWFYLSLGESYKDPNLLCAGLWTVLRQICAHAFQSPHFSP